MNKMLKFWISVFGVSDVAAPEERPVGSQNRLQELKAEQAEKLKRLYELQDNPEIDDPKERSQIERRLRDIERLMRVYNSVSDF
ncbi:MAG TPA: hypothetical protein PLO56_11485 [Rhodothermales bacterium]|nr:hypothetical protein [Rhodothermales bacterium]